MNKAERNLLAFLEQCVATGGSVIENHSVQATKQQLRDAFDAGMYEGYHDAAKPLPSWYFDRPLARLTARERGWWYGRESRLQEEGAKE